MQNIASQKAARTLALAGVLVGSFGATSANAQDASPPVTLPTAPGAEKAVIGGPTQAAASLPGNGGSALEPYLVTWLLPIAGIACAAIGIGVDKRLRASRGGL